MQLSSVFLVVRIWSGPTSSRTNASKSVGLSRIIVRRPTHVRGVKMERLQAVFKNVYDASGGIEIRGAQRATERHQFARQLRRRWGPHP